MLFLSCTASVRFSSQTRIVVHAFDVVTIRPRLSIEFFHESTKPGSREKQFKSVTRKHFFKVLVGLSKHENTLIRKKIDILLRIVSIYTHITRTFVPGEGEWLNS